MMMMMMMMTTTMTRTNDLFPEDTDPHQRHVIRALMTRMTRRRDAHVSKLIFCQRTVTSGGVLTKDSQIN